MSAAIAGDVATNVADADTIVAIITAVINTATGAAAATVTTTTTTTAAAAVTVTAATVAASVTVAVTDVGDAATAVAAVVLPLPQLLLMLLVALSAAGAGSSRNEKPKKASIRKKWGDRVARRRIRNCPSWITKPTRCDHKPCVLVGTDGMTRCSGYAQCFHVNVDDEETAVILWCSIKVLGRD